MKAEQGTTMRQVRQFLRQILGVKRVADPHHICPTQLRIKIPTHILHETHEGEKAPRAR